MFIAELFGIKVLVLNPEYRHLWKAYDLTPITYQR
jgi:hypothetical protein